VKISEDEVIFPKCNCACESYARARTHFPPNRSILSRLFSVFQDAMGCGVAVVDELLTKVFYKIGKIVGRHPGYFIIVPFLLTALCVTGYQRIKYEIDPEYLFCPINGQARGERATVEHFFKMNYSSLFNVGRITRPGRFGRIIAIPRHGNDMLTRDIWTELRLLDEIIRNTTVPWEGGYFKYDDVCARWQGDCFTNDILNLDYVIDEVSSTPNSVRC